MASKSALVLGMCNYDDERLATLHAPSSDVKALARVLSDTALGGFEAVTEHLDEGRSLVEKAISRLFADKQHDDLVLLYFSGHGLKDDGGDLYLAVKDTDHRDLDGTAVAADFIKRVMNKSNSRRQVLILDCCHSGAFSAGFKGTGVGSSAGTKAAFDPDGFGRIILTASDATQYAWEGEKITGDAQTSLYTSFLIEGIRTGAADLSRDGMITVNELHDYVYKRTVESTPKQRPTKICDHEKGNLILSRAPLHAAALPEEVTSALRSTLASVRQAMVGDLVTMFLHESPGTAISAYKALAAMTEDDSKAVQQAALGAIASCRGARPEIDPSLLGEIVLASSGKSVETSGELLALQKRQEEDAREAKKIQEEIAARAEIDRLERAAMQEKTRALFQSEPAREILAGSPVPPPKTLNMEAYIRADDRGDGSESKAQSTAVPGVKRDKMKPLAEMGTLVEVKGQEKEKQNAEKTLAEKAEPERLSQVAATALMRGSADTSPGSHATQPYLDYSLGQNEKKSPETKWRIDTVDRWSRSKWVFGLITCGTLATVLIAVRGNGGEASSSAPVQSSTATSTTPDRAETPLAKPKGPAKGLIEACVFDPVSNIRTLPTASSGIACSIDTVRTITVHSTPVQQGKGVWWQTDVCGGTVGFIAGNQVHVDAACP